ncbi:MAG: RNA methyltransferase [Parvularculaceae bacterium]
MSAKDVSKQPSARPPVSRGAGDLRAAPAIVLIEPQMGENIGASARAMLNFGLAEMRIVNPRDGWPNEKAVAMASGATLVIDRARLHATTAEALADRQYVVAMTARARESLTPVMSPAEAAARMKARIDRGEACAVLLGPERSGLSNADVDRADALVSIPVNPGFPSLNLAQAVLLMGYEWARADGRTPGPSDLDLAGPAPKAQFDGFINHLFAELEAANYFLPAERRPVMERKLRVALSRAGLSEGEVRMMRGVVKYLTRQRRAAAPGDDMSAGDAQD